MVHSLHAEGCIEGLLPRSSGLSVQDRKSSMTSKERSVIVLRQSRRHILMNNAGSAGGGEESFNIETFRLDGLGIH